MRVDDEVIDSLADEGARVVALALLRAADDEAERLSSNAEDEALHDFRVALRRLRTALRAFRPWLEADVERRVQKRLKRCARATNAARDTEVQLAWLRGRSAALPPSQQRAVEFLSRRLRRETKDAPSPVRIAERYRRASARLSKRLGTHRRRVETKRGGAGPRFGEALAPLLTDHLDAMSRRLEAVTGPLDEEGIHKARVETKRLRYLLEPLRGNRHADSSDTVDDLKRLQDVLGDLHDSHLLAREVRAAMMAAASQCACELFRAVYERGATGGVLRDIVREHPRAGLVALTRMVRARRDASFADLDREWRSGGVGMLSTRVRAIIAALAARAAGSAPGTGGRERFGLRPARRRSRPVRVPARRSPRSRRAPFPTRPRARRRS